MKEYNPEIFYSNYIIWERKSDFRMPNIFKEKKHIRKYVKYKDRLYPIHRNFILFRRYLNLQAIKLNEYIYIYFEYVLSINGTFYFLVYIVM